MNVPEKLKKLREQMEKNGVDAYIVLTDDFHSSEYVGDFFKCREYITGFTGSAGTAVITRKEAGLWTDGRYFIQAEQQLKGSGVKLYKMGQPLVQTLVEFLDSRLEAGQCIGYDGRTVNVAYREYLEDSLSDKELVFKTDLDLVGDIWQNRPDFPNSSVWELEEKYTGESRSSKLERIRKKMFDESAQVNIIASLDDIAWIYNLRGSDMEYNPVFMSYTAIYRDKAILYRNPDTIDENTKIKLEQDGVEIKPYEDIYGDMVKIKDTSIMMDLSTVNEALYSCLDESNYIEDCMNPSTEFKACKNETEMENVRKAHVIDGVAVTKLIYWLKKQQEQGSLTKLTELDVSRKLISLREQGETYIEQSFAPIIATGAHGAIVHYEPTEETDVPIEENTFLLMDTGGQYLYGTTDITRTVAIGEVTEEMKKAYTAVLQGHLALGHAYFKHGVTGANLDYVARRPLWDLGLDFNHGTGHGVGYLLNVHEGPNGVRLREKDGNVGVALEHGMITSNEPGVYLEGKYGIRTENLVLCVEDKKNEFGKFMRFDTLTMVPYDTDAIDFEMLDSKELKWLKEYHREVYENISAYLDEHEKNWLKKQCDI